MQANVLGNLVENTDSFHVRFPQARFKRIVCCGPVEPVVD
jgi:hypothetical protein